MCCSTTSTYGAAAALSFEGSEIFLYGGTGPDHGTFKVQLDDQPAVLLTGTSPVSHPNALLVSLRRLFKWIGVGANSYIVYDQRLVGRYTSSSYHE